MFWLGLCFVAVCFACCCAAGSVDAVLLVLLFVCYWCDGVAWLFVVCSLVLLVVVCVWCGSPFVCVLVSFDCVGVCVGAGVVCSVLTLFGRVLLLLLFMLLLCCAVFGLVLFRVCF